MKHRYRLLRLLLVGALSAGCVAVTAAPAQAADDPPCTNTTVTKYKTFGGWKFATQMPGGPNGIWCTLSYGAHNWSVVVLQIALNDCFFRKPNALKVDGIYGEDTMNVVKFLQTLAGITADGVYGPVTARSMNWGYRFTGAPPGDLPNGCYPYFT